MSLCSPDTSLDGGLVRHMGVRFQHAGVGEWRPERFRRPLEQRAAPVAGVQARDCRSSGTIGGSGFCFGAISEDAGWLAAFRLGRRSARADARDDLRSRGPRCFHARCAGAAARLSALTARRALHLINSGMTVQYATSVWSDPSFSSTLWNPLKADLSRMANVRFITST